MPWKERTVMTMRKDFVAAALSGEQTMSALCRKYGISRKTGYKWLERARNGDTLNDRSRAPQCIGNRTPPESEALVLSCRKDHPEWGPRKILRHLKNQGHDELPCKSTIGAILKRNGEISEKESEKHRAWERFERSRPNELWQMDFKGEFSMLNGKKCYPLDINDDHSRYSLCLEAMEGTRYSSFQPVMTRVMREHGLPDAILCDNGKPWGDNRMGITAFDVWMMQMDVLPIHGRPLHPQTQGKQERFHRTLKAELLAHRPMLDYNDAQKAFDEWRWCYNHERPHDALDLDCPAQHYRRSSRAFPEQLREPEYDTGTVLRRVNYKGYVSIHRHRYYLAEALIGRLVALREEDDEVILSYGRYDIARVDLSDPEPSIGRIRYSRKV